MSSLKRNNQSFKPRRPWKVFPFLSIAIILSFNFLPNEISSLLRSRVKLGNEIFLENFPSELLGKSLGLVINHTSNLSEGKHLVQALLDKGHKIQAIFSPEHGYLGNVEGGSKVRDSRFKDIKIYSLYGETKKPTLKQTRTLDAFVYDIQDIGARFYTYITTLKYVMEAAAEAKKPVYILDRPNPIGGKIIEGPLLRKEYTSFIGPLPIPVRYGLTSGELAIMMKGEAWVPESVDLHVIRMKYWRRSFLWEDTGLQWIPASPNIPTPETALIYPGSSFLGATNLNEGRGTSHPFLQFGAPWLDSVSIIKNMSSEIPSEIKLDAVYFTPRSLPGKALHPHFENTGCRGIRVSISRKEKFLSLRFGFALLKALKEQHPDKFTFNSRYLNLMFGNELLSHFLNGNISYDKLIALTEEDEKIFQKKRQKYLLYE